MPHSLVLDKRTAQPSFSSFLFSVNYFPPKLMLQTSRYFVAISVADVVRIHISHIPPVHGYVSRCYVHLHKSSTVISCFIWKTSSQELLVCGRDSREAASPITTMLTTSILVLTVTPLPLPHVLIVCTIYFRLLG